MEFIFLETKENKELLERENLATTKNAFDLERVVVQLIPSDENKVIYSGSGYNNAKKLSKELGYEIMTRSLGENKLRKKESGRSWYKILRKNPDGALVLLKKV